jgi:hypothetical protein
MLTYQDWHSQYVSKHDMKHLTRGSQFYYDRATALHKAHPQWTLSEINSYIRKRKKPTLPPPPPTPQGWAYEVKCGIEYRTKDPHQSRRGYLTATVYTTRERNQQELLNTIFSGPQTNSWLDGVKPNRITSWDTGAPARTSRPVTRDHASNVHVRDIHGW